MNDNIPPERLHPFAILPDEDSDEAYCKRHQSDHDTLAAFVKKDGGLYTIADGFEAYVCHQCVAELSNKVASESDLTLGEASSLLTQRFLHERFSEWDNGDAFGDWFEYYGEVGDGLSFFGPTPTQDEVPDDG